MSSSLPSLKKFPADCHAKLLELHKKYNWGEDELDAFTANGDGSLNADKLPKFQAFLEQEMERRAPKKPVQLRVRSSMPTGGLKRKFGGQAAPESAAGPQEITTPPSKRTRDEEAAGSEKPVRGTPEPLSKPNSLKVSIKSSVNAGNLTKPSQLRLANMRLLGDSKLWTGERQGQYSWMDETVAERAAKRDERLQELETPMIAAAQSGHPGLAAGIVGVPSQAEAVISGRIVCEGLEGRLNERSMLLEGSLASSNGARVQLNVAECPRVAAFPGQMVSVIGRSGMTGSTFHAREFLPGLPAPSRPLAAECSLRALVVAGPFCLRDGLDYTPLESVLAHAIEERPEVLIILGPFLDGSNQKVASGDTCLQGEEPCSFEEIYAKKLLPLLVRGLTPLRQATPATEVLIVPSLEEVLCFHPLPQPPLDAMLSGSSAPPPGSPLETLKRLGVQFLPNPAHIEINGIKLSLTSTDALSPVLREIVLRPEGRKIEEALRLLLRQRGLFPVVPREPAQVCESRAAALDFPQGAVPDICIFPSASGTANGMIVDETIFVNPGFVCRPAVLGSFAELWLAPTNGVGKPSMKERVRVDIHKLS